MSHISQEDLASFQEALKAEKARLERELALHGNRTERDDWQGSVGEFNEPENDPIDVADKLEELANNVPLVETLEHQLDEVNHALEKMDGGTYGMCEEGGGEIPLERLKANPAARMCIKHG